MVYKKPSADLQAGYRKTLEVGVIVALAMVIAAFKFFPIVQPPDPPPIHDPEVPPVILPPNTEQPKLPPPPSIPPIQPGTSDDVLPDDIDPRSELDPHANIPPPRTDPREDLPEFEVIYEIPDFVGGPEALVRNLVYPEIAQRVGHQGIVVVTAYVDETGSVVRAEVLSGIGLGCDEAAVAALMKTKFHPATQRGKPVKVKLTIPIRFRIQ